jgi:hypothetical protein
LDQAAAVFPSVGVVGFVGLGYVGYRQRQKLTGATSI